LPLHTHVKRAKAYDPGEIPSPRHLGFQDVAFWSDKTIGFPIEVFRGSTPSAPAFGPLAPPPTLKRAGCPTRSKAEYRWLAKPCRTGVPPVIC